jgi:hypothetical protein
MVKDHSKTGHKYILYTGDPNSGHPNSGYSRPPNTVPRSVFRFDLMPVPDIRVRFASLDHFGMNIIFFMALINKTV